MKVKAIAPGYFGHARIKPGSVFEMPEASMKEVDGKAVLPSWVIPADQDLPSKKSLKLPGAKVVKQPKAAGDKQIIPPVQGNDKGEGKGEAASTGDSDVI